MTVDFFSSRKYEGRRLLLSTVLSFAVFVVALREIIRIANEPSILNLVLFGLGVMFGVSFTFGVSYRLSVALFGGLAILRKMFHKDTMASASTFLSAEWNTIKNQFTSDTPQAEIQVIDVGYDKESDNVNIEFLINHKYGVLKLNSSQVSVNTTRKDWVERIEFRGDNSLDGFDRHKCHICNIRDNYVKIGVYSNPQDTSAGVYSVCKGCIKESIEATDRLADEEMKSEILVNKI